MNTINAVFEGGGVKGIGLVGAASVVEEKGYQFGNVAGTSAGAIVAALIAAGYVTARLKEIVESVDYNKFKDPGLLDRIPLLGPALSLGFEKGIYEGDFVENWIRDLLENAPDGPVTTFGDLPYMDDGVPYGYRLQVIAADLTRGKMLTLPWDIKDYGLDPSDLSVALAVRMSMSIPFFYEPVIFHGNGADCYIVDGGILSNYPVWLFDNGGNPARPTIGFKLVEPSEDRPNPIHGPITLFAAMFNTMMEAHDKRHIKESDFKRTIPIPTLGVRTTDFDLSRDQSNALYESGRKAALKFFDG